MNECVKVNTHGKWLKWLQRAIQHQKLHGDQQYKHYPQLCPDYNDVVSVHQTSQTENTFQKVSTQQVFCTQVQEHETVTSFNPKSQKDILRQQVPVASIEPGNIT